jgi:uncharacterized protein (DUF983 family)
MTLRDLFSGWQNSRQLVKSSIIACICIVVIGTIIITEYGGFIPLWPLIIVLFGLYQLLCLILAYRIIKNNK